MVDPFNPETEFDLASISEREREAINSLFAPEGPQQEIQSFLSAPSVNLAQAQKLIETRDNPQSIDILGGLGNEGVFGLRQGFCFFNAANHNRVF